MSRSALSNLPNGWLPAAIGDLVTIVYGEGLRVSERANVGGIPVYGSGGIVGEHSRALHNGPSIIIGRKGSIGSVYYSPGPFWCIDTAFYLDNISPFVDVEYLAHILRFIDLSRLGITVGVPGINRQDLARQEVTLPPLSEQQHIADILRYADDLRRQRSEADELAQQLLPALFYEMFGDPHPQRNTLTKRSGKLGDIFKDLGTGGTPSRNKSEYYGGEHYWVKTTELVDGIITETEETLTDAGLNSSNAKLYPPDTILVAMYGQGQTRGRTGKLAVYAACNQAAAAFPPSEEILPDYLWYWFQLSYERIRSLGRGGPQANLNLKILKDLRIPIPLKEQQQVFADLVGNAKVTLVEQRTASRELENLFQAILARAFSGELTEIWREKHQAELQEEIAKRDQWLEERGVQRSVPIPTTIAQPVITDNILLTRLSSTQQRVYALAQNHPNSYFTLQTLGEGQEDDAPLDRDVIERGLSMLEALGIILKVSVPVSPTGEAFYQNVYRLAAKQPIEEELRTLKDRYPNIRL